MYAPTTKPTAADTIPENAASADVFLKKDTITIIIIVAEAEDLLMAIPIFTVQPQGF